MPTKIFNMIVMVAFVAAIPLCYANVGEGVAFVTNRNSSESSSRTRQQLFKNPFEKAPEPEPLTAEEKSQMFLDDLGMESSSEPRVFYTDPKRAVDIATSFMPVRNFVSKFFLQCLNPSC